MKMRSTLGRLGLPVLLAVAALLPPAAAQTPQPGAEPGIFGEILDVRVVNLEVVVTDKQGVLVRGLRPEDFLLRIDGEEVPIDYFSEVRSGLATAPGAGVEGAVEGVPALVPGEPVGTSYLVFIDDYFTIARDRNLVIDSLLEDVARLGSEDRMAIVAFDGRDLEMLTTWTGSAPVLERALKKARLRKAHGLERLSEQRQFDFDRTLVLSQRIRNDLLPADDFFRTHLDPSERFFVERLASQVERTVAAATATLRSFAQPPGRKAMVLLSGGWPYFPAEFLGSFTTQFILPSDVEQGESLFRPLSDTANLLGYTLYPVDVPGFSDEIVGAEARLSPELTAAAGGPAGVLGRSSFLRQQEVHYSLDFLARETGGRSFLDGARREVLERVVSDTRSYYWLGFTPRREWDDRRHEIEIEVRHPKLKVRSRAGFLDSSRQHEVTMAVESTLLFGNSPGEGELHLSLGEAQKAGRGKMRVPLEVLVPLEEVTFLPTGDGHASQLELRIAVRDDEGRRAEIPVIPVTLRVPEAPAAGMAGRYTTELKLRRRPHEAVVAIYDPASGRILSAATAIKPPSK